MSTLSPPPTIDATDADFQQTVVEASHEVPVLVDFWAPWCEPCKVLGPVLEKLAGEYEGRLKLVKVNLDENPMLAQALMIRSIPMVKLIMNGEIRDEFMGAYPEPEVRQFLERHLPTVADEGAAGGLQAYVTGDRARARASFEATLREEPRNAVALIGMGSLAMDEGNLADAKSYLAGVNEVELDDLPDKALPQKALAVLRARVFLTENGAAENGAPPAEAQEAAQELEGRFVQACRRALEGGYEEALQEFLAIVKEDRAFREDGGRKGMLAVFDLLPPDSPLLSSYRSQLSSVLFS